MRIAHILLTKQFAGTERHVVELTAAQAAAGHDVTLVLRRKAARDAPDAIAHRVDPRVRIALVDDWVARWPAVVQARRLVRRMRPDVAHAHLGMACSALRGLEGVVPRLATLHLDYDPVQHDHLDGLIAIAPWQLATLPAELRNRSVQIDNWTAPTSAGSGAREAVRARIGVGRDEFLFGAVGRIVQSKGMDVLLSSFNRAALPRTRLAIVGQGRELQRLQQQASPAVALPGFAGSPIEWMAAFDCFVSPAREEPFGLVLLEAMQAGLPIIATATTGAQHLSALIATPLVPIDDPDALAAALAVVAGGGPRRVAYDLSRFRVEPKVEEMNAFYRLSIERLRVSQEGKPEPSPT